MRKIVQNFKFSTEKANRTNSTFIFFPTLDSNAQKNKRAVSRQRAKKTNLPFATPLHSIICIFA